jgi:hypothetical protein
VIRVQEGRVDEKIVIGLFASKGIAEDAMHRLVHEGVSPADLRLRLLHETTPLPPHMESEMAALEVDPFIWGNARDTFAPYIHNGETALLVRARDEAEADFAAWTIKQYAPTQIAITNPQRELVLVDIALIRAP